MSDNNIWKFNWSNVPWVTGENADTKAKDTPAAKPAGERKKLEKPPPQAVVESVEIDTSQEIKEDFPYSGSGKLRVLEGATLTECRLYIQPLYRYRGKNDTQDKEENREQATEVLVDKKTLTFKFTIDSLFEPNAYYLDKEKAADAKYRLLVKVVGPQLDKDYFSKEVELPMESKDVILKKDCYDDVWADGKKDPDKFPKSGEN